MAKKESGFITEDFLLKGETAKALFHNYAEDLPIIDYHCHISPREIYEDKSYDNITQVWLYGDHYKWRIMRACGIDEELITGNASDRDKFFAYAGALELSIGNPLYHWSHMELKKYFGFDGVLNSRSAEEVWDFTNKAIEKEPLTARSIIEKSNVEVICTTDDPVDDLSWHQKIREEGTLKTKVLPAWRPDKLINIEKEEFSDYIEELSRVTGRKIAGFSDLKIAIMDRMDFFGDMGCSVSDHGIDYVPYVVRDDEELDEIFRKGLAGEDISGDDCDGYKTGVLLFLAKEYRKRNWVMQLHYGCARNVNSSGFKKLGPDTGFDCIGDRGSASDLLAFMDEVEANGGLPKTIIYSLDPEEDPIIDTIAGSFSEGGVRGKVQHGSAWWFNDHKPGMEAQMTSLAARGVLGNFIGMLTDSRSFLSYARHEYFRRILCNLVGELVDGGEYPRDEASLKKIIQGVSYDNAKEYFDF